ncbi:hypothetical protein SSBR45G_17390 [Bradyrhizobium sp. SSBR45G]|nr:hypothetical protein SSBR45G_17390 [Bradyrhizobium sp. SSBR45G]GLH83589.1 hypothetical protein SSBR45R_10490 [Bradyrhizobium sp. SSBR45R]
MEGRSPVCAIAGATVAAISKAITDALRARPWRTGIGKRERGRATNIDVLIVLPSSLFQAR